MITLKEAVKNTVANFSYACSGILYYVVQVGEGRYQFPIDMNNKEDVGATYFFPEYKGITLMRYIRKAMESENFIKING